MQINDSSIDINCKLTDKDVLDMIKGYKCQNNKCSGLITDDNGLLLKLLFLVDSYILLSIKPGLCNSPKTFISITLGQKLLKIMIITWKLTKTPQNHHYKMELTKNSRKP